VRGFVVEIPNFHDVVVRQRGREKRVTEQPAVVVVAVDRPEPVRFAGRDIALIPHLVPAFPPVVTGCCDLIISHAPIIGERRGIVNGFSSELWFFWVFFHETVIPDFSALTALNAGFSGISGAGNPGFSHAFTNL